MLWQAPDELLDQVPVLKKYVSILIMPMQRCQYIQCRSARPSHTVVSFSITKTQGRASCLGLAVTRPVMIRRCRKVFVDVQEKHNFVCAHETSCS